MQHSEKVTGEVRRATNYIILIAVVVSVVAGAYSIFVTARFNDIRNYWNGYADVPVAKGRLIAELSDAIGYDGFIHNFKNYVIRMREDYRRAAIAQHREALGILRAYADTGLTDTERNALATIRRTLDEYRAKLDVAAAMVATNTNTAEIDAVVAVDDKPMIAALAILRDHWVDINRTGEGRLVGTIKFVGSVSFIVQATILGAICLTLFLYGWMRKLDKTAAQLLREIYLNAERFREMFRLGGDAVITINKQGVIEDFNQTATELFGYSEDEAVGHDVSILLPEAERHSHVNYVERSTMYAPRIINQPRGLMAQRKDGELFNIELNVSPFQVAGEEKFVGIVRDASKRRALEDQFRETFEHVGIGNIVFDENGRIELFNAAAEEIFGYARDNVRGVHVAALVKELDSTVYATDVTPRGASKFRIAEEFTGVYRDGREFPIQVNLGRLKFRGRNTFICSIIDLTEVKELERKLFRSQRLEAVGQLTGGIAHDFNNVMTIILGNAERLEDRVGDNEQAKSLVDSITRAVLRGSSLTARLLAFSRQQTLSPRSVDVTSLVDDLEDILRRTLGEAVTLNFDRGEDLWSAMVDPANFESALVNLAINARDAMPDGGTLDIETANVTLDETYTKQFDDVSPGDYVQIAVSDSGTGMPPDILEKVFEPFFTTKDTGKGSGLGLSMVYGFVKQSNGHITVYSEVGEGTTVKIYLPRSDEPADVERSEAAEVQPLQPRNARILVVEDDENVRQVAVGLLRDQGYDVVEATTGRSAIDILKTDNRFDLLFTDVVLPGGMNGVAVAAEAKRLHPRIKFLYTTGYTQDAVIHHERLDEGITVVNKPYRRTDLLEKIAKVLDSLSLLLIADDAALRTRLSDGLKAEGFDVRQAASATDGIEAFEAEPADIVVVDVAHDAENNVATLRRFNERADAPKTIALCADDHHLAHVQAAGTATVVYKPFAPKDVVGAVRRLMWRTGGLN